MARKTIEEQLKELEEKERILKARKQQLIAKSKKQERKDRTRRLIQNGALAEKYLDCEGLSPEEFEKELQRIVKLPSVKKEK